MGEPNGVLKGRKGARLANGKANGNAGVPRRPSPPARATWRFLILNNVLRLFAWYAIATVLFRCPSTVEECDDDSPTICKTYFQAKSAVVPHIEPYFDAYAAPYMEIASPYITVISEKVVEPTRSFVVHHGAPRLAQAQAYTQAQWLKSGKPQVDRLQAAAKERYQSVLGPHVDRASDAISPYLDLARTSALQTYYEVLVPTYDLAEPYAVQTYDAACMFTTEIAIPSVSWTFSRTYMFLDDNVLPHIRAVYTESVEPQLIRIGERLGRYKGSPSAHAKKSAAASRESKSKLSTSSSSSPAISEFKKPSQPAKPFEKAKREPKLRNIFSKASSSVESLASSQTASPASADSDVPALKKEKPSKEEVMRIARETVAEDLDLWQTKFANAADEGASEIEDKVNKISQQFQETRIDTAGSQLLSQLERVSHDEVEKLKKEIVSLIERTKDQDAVDLDASADEVIAAVRRAGLAIKGKAEDVRNWREAFEQEIHEEVTGAAQQHFNILGSIRDLALQKIGMKWAWMDGITYKDWAKYHEMKRKFEEWTDDLQQLIVSNPTLEAVMDAAANVEDRAMEIAQGAAAELGRLKEVAGWKMIAGDASDNFDIDAMKQAAEAAAGVDDVDETDQTADETEDTPSEDPIVDEAVQEERQLGDEVSKEPASDTVIIQPVEEVSTTPDVEDEKTEPNEETVVIEANNGAESGPSTADADGEAIESIQSPIIDSLPVIVDNLTEAIEKAVPPSDEDNHPAQQEQDTATVKPALFGAAAQIVPGRQAVLDDDDEDMGDKIASVTAMVHAAYSSAISQASIKFSMAMSVISAQVSGTPQPAHESLFASVSSAYSNAVASASSQMGDALDAVTKGAISKPTQTPSPLMDWAAIESVASEKLEEGRIWAEQQYESAKIVLGLATPAPTPTSSSEKLLEQAKMNYYAGLGLAYARYSEFMSAATSALNSLTANPTPTPTNIVESASSMASVAGESAASAAKAVKDSVNSVVDGAESAVAQSWEVVVSHISVQIYGAPTPTAWYDPLYSLMGSGSSAAGTATNAAVVYAASASNMAAEQYSAVSSIVSELILGKDPPFTESIFSRLNLVYTAGVSMADAATSAVSSAASAATEAVKEKVEHVRDEL